MPVSKGSPQKSWFLYGPQGCGKSRIADRLAASLGLRRILEGWHQGQPFPAMDTLVITTDKPQPFGVFIFERRILSYEQAAKRVREMEGAQSNRDPADVRRRPVQHSPQRGVRHG